MCGQFAQEAVGYDLREQLGIDHGTLRLTPSARIRPTERISVVAVGSEGAECFAMDWGLVLDGLARPVINARGETLGQKPLFCEAFAQRRCLIPMTAWFEWRQEGRGKVGYRFARTGVFSVAGLWWPATQPGEAARVVMVTVSARAELQEYHGRMPLSLEAEAARQWLLSGPTALPEPLRTPIHIEPMITYGPRQENLF
ncbi:SOS response-associated peptidase [Ferrimonas pelagia]|uniref:Abasic site processing protein n=1 Tax=Ferrimonas pelagia TaxID=1177826 RepID=A0ABP9EGK5_9GAMM